MQLGKAMCRGTPVAGPTHSPQQVQVQESTLDPAGTRRPLQAPAAPNLFQL